MSGRNAKLYEALKRISEKDVQVIPATVTAVEGDTITVDVDGLEFFDVRLQSFVGGAAPGVMLKPKIGSVVLIERIGTENEYFVVMYSGLDAVDIKVGDSTYSQDAEGFSLTHDGESLKTLLKELIQGIQAITVQTNTGPSGTPINTTTFTTLSSRIEKLFK